MLVKAVPGIKVPKEDKPREYITDAEVVEVPDTQYYRARIVDGDLLRATSTKSKKGAE